MANLIRVTASTSAQVAAAVNAGRQTILLENSDANTCYVLVGPGTVSSTNYSLSLAQGNNAAFPCRDRISVIWGTAGSGELKVTEIE